MMPVPQHMSHQGVGHAHMVAFGQTQSKPGSSASFASLSGGGGGGGGHYGAQSGGNGRKKARLG